MNNSLDPMNFLFSLYLSSIDLHSITYPLEVKIHFMRKATVLPPLPFEFKENWADWLAKQHDKSAGVWLKLGKKGADIPSVTYEEALDVALCYG